MARSRAGAPLAGGSSAPQYPTIAERRKYAPDREQCAVTFLARIFGPPRDRLALRPLYAAIVERARDPAWYRDGGVPDTLDGRFEMVSAMLALVLLRLEGGGEAAAAPAALLAETFVEDMDGTLREI